MASDNGKSFPFSALSVVALFVSTALLGPQAFQLWRPSEPLARKQMVLPDPPVEARLWEDPLAAIARFRDQVRETCERSAEVAGDRTAVARCERSHRVSVEQLQDQLAQRAKAKDRLTIMAVLLQGGSLVGADESRRRTRYAVLAALSTRGFIPDDSDHIALLRAKACDQLHGCLDSDKEEVDVAFETLHMRSGVGETQRVIVFWIDDTRVRTRWLGAITVLLAGIAPDNADLRIIGPVTSDSLSRGLRQDAGNWAAEIYGWDRARPKGLDNFRRNLGVVRQIRIFSPFASASISMKDLGLDKVLSPQCGNDCADIALKHFIKKAANALHLPTDGLTATPRFFMRTVVQDDALVGSLLEELRQRGVNGCEGGRLVLISEWDSAYARRFGYTLTDKLRPPVREPGEKPHEREKHDCPSVAHEALVPVIYSFARGLDGATVDRSAEQARVNAKASDEDKDKRRRPPEWPEGQAQEDYVHRLIQQIRFDDRDRPVRAIGLVANDLHDKLILAQALRETFRDRVLFTTDMDARLLHPTTTRWTRNMIVASGMPLDPTDIRAAYRPRDCTADGRFGPFRDSYQTATFVAAQLASCPGEPDVDALEKAIGTPVLYELGRTEARSLGAGLWERDRLARQVTALVGFVAVAGLAWMILWVSPGSAMTTARHLRFGGIVQSPWQVEYRGSKVFVAALEWAALGYAVGVLTNLGWSHLASSHLPLLLGAFAALLVPTLVFPETGWISKPSKEASTGAWRGYRPRWFRVILASALCVAVLVVTARKRAFDVEEPFDLLSGTSAWPSLLVLTLMIVLIPWFIDRAWFDSSNSLRELANRFFGSSPPVRPVVFWSPQAAVRPDGTIDGARIWRSYRRTMHDQARLTRVLLWFCLAGAGVLLLALTTSYMVDRPAMPQIPARDEALRRVILHSQIMAGIGLLLLLVLVVDDTFNTWRFVITLKEGRTVYPARTVHLFASELGAQMAVYAETPIAAKQRRRFTDETPPKLAKGINSILDNWIDARLLADQTEASGPLILYPFLLVGLAIVARSPILDNWDIGPGVMMLIGVYLVGSIAMAILLNKAAERARRQVLLYMARDLTWLEGSDEMKPLAPTFKDLIERVKNLRRGAFAPFFERPWVQALLVPLGGAGGVQLLEFLLYARPQ